MTTFAVQGTIIVLSILLYGLFAMSETVLVSARKGGLRERADAGDKGRALRWSWRTRRTGFSPPCRSGSP